MFMNETSKVTPFHSRKLEEAKACECAERWKDLEYCIEKQISVEHADMWAQSWPWRLGGWNASHVGPFPCGPVMWAPRLSTRPLVNHPGLGHEVRATHPVK